MTGTRRQKSSTGGEPPLRRSKWLKLALGTALFLSGVLAAIVGFYYVLPHRAPAVPDPDRSVMEPQVAAKIQQVRGAVLADPESPEDWGRLGMVFHAHGLEKEARECYSRAAALEPSEFRWPYLLAHIMRDADPQGALVQIEKAFQAKPDYSALYVLRAQILERNNQLDAALEQYEKAAAIDALSAMAEFGMGRIYLTKRELEASLRHLQHARELSPNVGAIRASLAQVYRRLGNRDAAVTEARLASELGGKIAITDPIHFEMKQEEVSSLALLARARATTEAGNYKTAEALYYQLLEIRPDDANIHAGLADVMGRQDKHQEAKEQCLAALSIDPKHASALHGLANILTLELNYAEAALRYEESLAIRPRHVPSRQNLGTVLAFQGKIDEAVAQFRKGLEIDPDHFECNHQLGQLLLTQRKFSEATVYLRAASEARPELGPLHAQLAMALTGKADFKGAWIHVEEAERLGVKLPHGFLQELTRVAPRPGKGRP